MAVLRKPIDLDALIRKSWRHGWRRSDPKDLTSKITV